MLFCAHLLEEPVINRHFRMLVPLCLALAASTGGMRAQDPKFGIQGGLNIPFGDLSDAVDGRVGFTLGANVGFYYGDGHELRPRMEYTIYQGGWHPTGNGNFERNNVSAWGLGVDYIHYTDLRPSGFYLLMGIGNQWWQVSPSDSPSRSNSGLYLSAGAGFRANRNLSYEGRFSTGQFQNDRGQANQLQGVVTFRF
jgi:hypothetical protein